MSSVEFETETLPQARSRDLSDEVIAVDTLRDENQINWNNAVDPSFDFSQRYTAVLAINNANQEYPGSATGANLPTVAVDVRLYIRADGTIGAVKILNVRSPGSAHQPFLAEFKEAARRVILYRTRLKNQPYREGGVPKDFVWETTIKFNLR